ncbi:unnamed protein product [Zymoseptoria tritici ST99CH_3D1]|nr:unnamed protein product [Zymoseptoria tritici ST99CH_1E4]SMR57719.1 unnamed protein product [Zymoseptoria tritici ST99CH_3D1]
MFRSILGLSGLLASSTASTLAMRGVEDFSGSLFPRTQTDGASEWPYGPFSTRGRDIVNARGEAITWAGVNWPGSGETMIPEGLEFASVEDLVAQIDSVGFNFIRLTYAIEMVDQMYERNMSDIPLEIALITGLGYENGTKVTKEIIEKNPTWTKDTTRFEIWDAIANAAANRSIYVHPDVHVGKAQWCCNNTDGNAWFDDYNFPVANWKRGLQFVAEWAKDHRNVVSMALRNELRRAINETAPTSTIGYNWLSLVGNNTAATDAIHEVNPDILVSWSGMQYDQDLAALTTGLDLNTAPCYKCDVVRDGYRRDPIIFNLDDHPWADKVVYELHLYSMSEDLDTGSCPLIQAQFYSSGFNAMGIDKPEACNITGDCVEAVRQTPVILSEFGWAQDETLFNDTLQTCLRDFTTQNNVSWAVWAFAGSYRVRSGGQGVPDTWGLTNYNFSDWNYPKAVEDWFKPWVAESLG